MKNIVLNTSNIAPNSGNTKFEYRFPTTQKFEGMDVALANFTTTISWVNIADFLNNNQYAYIWYDAGGPTFYPFVMVNGFYTIDRFNAYLNRIMTLNGHYLVNPAGEIVYFLEFLYNTTYRALEIRSTPIPSALPAGWSNPTGITFPAVDTTPIIFIPDTNIQRFTGFTVGAYPSLPQTTIYNGLSQSIPDINPVDEILILCSLCNNSFQYPNELLFSFQPLGEPGFVTVAEPKEYIFVPVEDGYYSGFDIQLLNQNQSTFYIIDPEIFMQLIFQKRTDKQLK